MKPDGLPGPFGPMLLDPPVGDALQELGVVLRYRGVLTDRFREAAIVAAAAVFGADYELRAHIPLARAAGLDGKIDALLAGDDSQLDPVLAAVTRAARGLAAQGRVGDADAGRLVAHLGADGLFELVVLVGYYRILSGILATYRLE